MIFIAKCQITETPYMCKSRHYDKTHLVDAENESAATQKIERYYRNKDESYAVSYSVYVTEIDEMITDETIL
jgi:hypothetical protein